MVKPVKKKQAGKGKKVKETRGVVVSDKMDKTAVVAVSRLKKHPRYHKRYVVTRKYKVHDEKNQAKEGVEVSFVSCRPISHDKRWRIVSYHNDSGRK